MINLLTFLNNMGYAKNQAVVYGFSVPSHFIPYLEYQLGYAVDDYMIKRKQFWQDNRAIEPVESEKYISEFKLSLDTVVLENWKRIKEGLPVIPLLFLIDYESRPTNERKCITNESISGKEPFITNSEIRRCFKLAHHPNGEVARAAKYTFVFIKLTVLKNLTNDPKGITQGKIEKIPAPWERPDWVATWKRACRNPGSKSPIEGYMWKFNQEKKGNISEASNKKISPFCCK